jgi:pantetheine-phosphate adenylyltransferase
MNVAVYPGSFDPITSGHLDVIRRAALLFDRVIVGVLVNPRKEALLPAEERIAIIRDSIDASAEPAIAARIDVAGFDGLTVEFCRSVGARSIVRGLRAISDFEAEIQLSHNNRRLAPEIDTVFFMTAIEHGYVSSSLVKEIAHFGGDVDDMVPPRAAAAVRRAFEGG